MLTFSRFQTMWEIKGHEEFAYERRPQGAEIHENPGPEAKNWKQLRQEKIKFEKNDPTVLIIGGGQNGLMVAARLGALGIPALIVEKNNQIGDNWANVGCVV
jgi:NADPH-dependent 2,4-dienoyl-CoA reductase/sulfur reductase-like enzyme